MELIFFVWWSLQHESCCLENSHGCQRSHSVDWSSQVSDVPLLVVVQRSLHINILWLLEDDLLDVGWTIRLYLKNNCQNWSMFNLSIFTFRIIFPIMTSVLAIALLMDLSLPFPVWKQTCKNKFQDIDEFLPLWKPRASEVQHWRWTQQPCGSLHPWQQHLPLSWE